MLRGFGGLVALALTVGCGASSVSSVTGDAATTDLVAVDVGSLDAGSIDVATIDVGSLDAGSLDASVRDAHAPDSGRDVPPEARVCPRPFEDDVPESDVVEAGAPYVVDLAVESQLHHCAVMSDGTLRCRGTNYSGELGLGTSGWSGAEGRVPVEVPGLREVEQVVTIDMGVTCTRHRDGTVRCWGSNEYDMLGVGHAGDESCDRGRPCRRSPTLVPGLTDVAFLAAASASICAVSRDGSVRCWGRFDALLPRGGSPTPVLAAAVSDVARLRTLDSGWVMQRRSGEYAAYRVGPGGDPVSIPREAEFVDGDTTFARHLCYRLPDGTARCFGVNWFGKLGDGRSAPNGESFDEPWDPGLCGVRSVATGTYNSCALLVDRTVECWGSGEHGALGFDPPDRCVGLRGDEDAPCATHPAPVRGLDRVDRIFVGVWGGCALRLDRSVWCWGTLSPDLLTGELGPVAW